jgi:hypothetical protein
MVRRWWWGGDSEEVMVRRWSWRADGEEVMVRRWWWGGDRDVLIGVVMVRRWWWGSDREEVIVTCWWWGGDSEEVIVRRWSWRGDGEEVMRGMGECEGCQRSSQATMLGQPAFQLSFFGKSHRHPNPIQRSGKEDMDNVCQRLTFCCKPNPNWKPKDKHNGRITSLLSFRYSHSLKYERGIKILFKSHERRHWS